jgi:methionine-rich copper-binding protein CopC
MGTRPYRGKSMNKVTAVGLATILSLSWSVACEAHAKLQSSEPAANAQVAHAPATLTLHFSEQAQLAVLKLMLSGTSVPVTVDRGAEASSTVVVMLPALKPGKYQVEWSAIAADDGHVTKGSFSFTVLAA